MKNLLLASLIVSFLTFSCKKDDPKPLDDKITVADTALTHIGSFSSNAHPTSGSVKIYSTAFSQILSLEGFKTDNGPDLRVYLATAIDAKTYLDAGKLKSTAGNFNYTLDKNLKIEEYKYVLIWCEDFSVLFGNSLLVAK